MSWQATKTIVRDAGCLVMGFGGIAFQQITGDVNPYLLVAYMAMLGLPGGLALWQLRGAGKQATPPTPSPSSPSPSSSSSPSP